MKAHAFEARSDARPFNFGHLKPCLPYQDFILEYDFQSMRQARNATGVCLMGNAHLWSCGRSDKSESIPQVTLRLIWKKTYNFWFHAH